MYGDTLSGRDAGLSCPTLVGSSTVPGVSAMFKNNVCDVVGSSRAYVLSPAKSVSICD